MKILNSLMAFAFAVVLATGSATVMADNDHDNKGHSTDHGKDAKSSKDKKDNDKMERGDKDKQDKKSKDDKDKDHGKKDKDKKDKDKKDDKDKDHGKKDDDKDHIKIGVCHNTGSETEPVVFIQVSAKAAAWHEREHGDLIGVDSIDDCALVPPPLEIVAMCATANVGDLGLYTINVEYDPNDGTFLSVPGETPELVGGVTIPEANMGELFALGNEVAFTIIVDAPVVFTGTSASATVESVDFPVDSSDFFGSLTLMTGECVDLPLPSF